MSHILCWWMDLIHTSFSFIYFLIYKQPVDIDMSLKIWKYFLSRLFRDLYRPLDLVHRLGLFIEYSGLWLDRFKLGRLHFWTRKIFHVKQTASFDWKLQLLALWFTMIDEPHPLLMNGSHPHIFSFIHFLLYKQPVDIDVFRDVETHCFITTFAWPILYCLFDLVLSLFSHGSLYENMCGH